MKRLLVAAALAPLSFAAGQASAQTLTTSGGVTTATYGSNTTTPIISNGDNVAINSGVTVQPTTGGTAAAQAAAVTLNSGNTLSNSGAISYPNSGAGTSYVTGILVKGGNTTVGSVANVGTITLNETTNYTDTKAATLGVADGYLDSNNNVLGQYAQGFNRIGIQTDSSQFNGTIGNSGTISIIGENSAGIQIGAGGISGALTNSGTITVVGGNSTVIGGTTPAPATEISYGIHTLGTVGGEVQLSGTITATGQRAVGVDLGGNVGGNVDINATITATGYRSTTAPLVPGTLSLMSNGASSELQAGGSALIIGGSVANGISLEPAVTAVAASTGTSATAAVVGAAITSYGRAPALLIGGGADTTIGAGTSSSTVLTGVTGSATNYGLLIGGTVYGLGIYSYDSTGQPVGASGLAIGTTGHQVTIDNGIGVSGIVSASAVSNAVVPAPNGATTVGGAAIAVNIGDAVTPKLDVSGSVIASVTSSLTTTPYNQQASATAVLLGANSHVATLNNTGNIEASITGVAAVATNPATPAVGGATGIVTAIKDTQGNLTTINNYNVIASAITPIDPTALVDPTRSSIVAIDVRANTAGININQAADSALTGTDTTGTTTTYTQPQIIGDVLFGSGAAHLNLQAGTLTGGVSFGSSTDNSLTVNGATMTGALAQASGGQLTVNVGTTGQASLLDITSPTSTGLTTLGVTPAQSAIVLNSLHVGSTGQLILTVNSVDATHTLAQVSAVQLQVNGAATFDSGAKIGLNFLTKLTQPTTYDVIRSTGPLTIANTSTVLGNLPFLYTGSVTDTNNTLAITVTQQTAKKLGLNAAEASAYDAVYNAFDKTDTVGIGSISAAVLGATSRSQFIHIYDQFLPDYSGGPFQDLVVGQQSIARAEADSGDKLEGEGSRGWVQEIGYYNSRTSTDEVNGYNGKGYGLAGGTEQSFGRSAFGFAGAFLSSSVSDLGRSVGSSQGANAVEAGVYWRTGGEGLNAGASLNGGFAFMESRRVLLVEGALSTDTATLYRQAKAHWIGGVGSGSFSLSYKKSFGRYYVRPEVMADYVLLYEQAYGEHGGGDAFDLAVQSKLSKEAIIQSDMVFGANFGTGVRWSPELTVGWRQVVYGGPGDVTASFAGGTAFKLSPAYQDQGGLMARLGVRASGNFADFSANAGGVFNPGYETYDARATARFLF